MYVPQEFHILVRSLEMAQRDLARRQCGMPLEPYENSTGPRHDPRTVDEAYSIVCLSREWLYEWTLERMNMRGMTNLAAVKFM